MKAASKTFHFSLGGERRSLKVYCGTPVEDIVHTVKGEYHLQIQESIRFQDAPGVHVVLSHACPDGTEFTVCTNAAVSHATLPPSSRPHAKPGGQNDETKESPKVQLKLKTCPKNHQLQLRQLASGQCDWCFCNLKLGHGCIECNFDLCNACMGLDVDPHERVLDILSLKTCAKIVEATDKGKPERIGQVIEELTRTRVKQLLGSNLVRAMIRFATEPDLSRAELRTGLSPAHGLMIDRLMNIRKAVQSRKADLRQMQRGTSEGDAQKLLELLDLELLELLQGLQGLFGLEEVAAAQGMEDQGDVGVRQELQVDASRVRVDPSKELGKGNWTVVYKGELDGHPVAVKKAVKDEKELRREMCILQELSHENVVKLQGTCFKDGNLLEILELCHQGSLEQMVKEKAGVLDIPTRHSMAIDIAKGLFYLHSCRVYHGDLKLANILVTENNRCKLADFNLAKSIPEGKDFFHPRGGTTLYSAPEVLKSKEASFSSDIYGLGLCLYELLTVQDYAKVVRKMGGHDLLKWLSKGHMKVQLKGWPEEFASLQDVIDKCTTYSPAERPPASKVLDALKSLVLAPDQCAAASSFIGTCIHQGLTEFGFGRCSCKPSMETEALAPRPAPPPPAPPRFVRPPPCLAQKVRTTQSHVGRFATITDPSHPGFGCVVVLKRHNSYTGKWLVQCDSGRGWVPSQSLLPVKNLQPPCSRPSPKSQVLTGRPNGRQECRIEELHDEREICKEDLPTITEETSEDEQDEVPQVTSAEGDGCDSSERLSHVSTGSNVNAAVRVEEWSSDNECHDQTKDNGALEPDVEVLHQTGGFQYLFDFPYYHGIKRGEVALFDIRDVALAQHTEFRHGNRLERHDGFYFTVIGVKLNEKGEPKVYTQADEEAGAAFHEGDFSQFRCVGNLTVRRADPKSTTSSQKESSEQLDKILGKLLRRGKLDGLGRKKVAELLKGLRSNDEPSVRPACHIELKPEFQVRLRKSKRVVLCDVRDHACKQFGYVHGNKVLYDTGSGGMWLIVIGVWANDGQPALLLWRDGDSGAGILDPLPADMKVLKQLGPHEVRDCLGSDPPEMRLFTFPFLAGQDCPTVRKFDISREACQAFGFEFGDMVRDKQGDEYTVIGVGRPGAGRKWCKLKAVCLWAHKKGCEGAQPLRVNSSLSFVRRTDQFDKPKPFGPLGELMCTFRYPFRSSSSTRAGEFDVRPEICWKVAGVPGLKPGARVDFHGRLFTVIGAAYYRGCPQLWLERDGRQGATIFEKARHVRKLKLVSSPASSLVPCGTDVPILPMQHSLDWDEASDSDEEPELPGLRGLLKSDASQAALLAALKERLKGRGSRRRSREKELQLDKCLNLKTLNKQSSDGMQHSPGTIKAGDRVRSLSSDRVGIVTNVDNGVVRVDSYGQIERSSVTWHAKLEEVHIDECANLVKEGALVELREEVKQPACDWGGQSHADVVGVVQQIRDSIVVVNLGFRTWKGALHEFQAFKPSGCVQVGAHIRVKQPDLHPRYGWGEHKMREAIGVVAKIEDDDVEVNFPDKDKWRCKMDEIQVDSAANMIRPGEAVRVCQHVVFPQFDWGGVDHTSTGTVKSITHDGIAIVDFPKCESWHGLLSELEVATKSLQRSVRKRVAIVIGNHTYKHRCYCELKGAKNDAAKVSTKLNSLGFDFVLHVQNVRRSEIDTFLRQLEDQVEDGTIVVVYFAGHGEQDLSSVLLSAYDSDAAQDSTKISTNLIFNAIAEWPAKDLFICFVLDCCRKKSDDSVSGTKLTTLAPDPQKVATNQYYWVYSCQGFRSAFEGELGDFSKLWVDHLDKDLPVQQLFEKVSQQMGSRQRPQILQECYEATSIVLASDNNPYVPSGSVKDVADAEANSSSSESEHCMSLVNRLKSSIQEGDQRQILDNLYDAEQVLGADLFHAVEKRVLQGRDLSAYKEGLSDWEKNMFDDIFSSAQQRFGACTTADSRSRDVRLAGGDSGDVPNCVRVLAHTFQCNLRRVGFEWIDLVPALAETEHSLGPRFSLALKKAFAHLFIEQKQIELQMDAERPSVVDLVPECWVGDCLLVHLFDQSYIRNLAFVKKLCDENQASAMLQVDQCMSVVCDGVLGLSTRFTDAVRQLLTSKPSLDETTLHSAGFSQKEAEILLSVSRLSCHSKKSLLEFIPVAECVGQMANLVLDPLLTLQQWQLEGADQQRCEELLGHLQSLCAKCGWNLPLQLMVEGNCRNEEVLLQHLDQNESHLVSCILQVLLPC